MRDFLRITIYLFYLMAAISPDKSTPIALFFVTKSVDLSTILDKPFDPFTYSLHNKWCKFGNHPISLPNGPKVTRVTLNVIGPISTSRSPEIFRNHQASRTVLCNEPLSTARSTP